jgi:uncharacterized protein
MICADGVVSDLDEVMARFYAGATSAPAGQSRVPQARPAGVAAPAQHLPDTACLDRAYRERLAELTALQPGINLRRSLDVPEVPQLIGALAPEPDRIMAPSIASRPAPSRASSSTTTRRARS